jgi:peptide/nickel transport system substrate-binding protein
MAVYLLSMVWPHKATAAPTPQYGGVYKIITGQTPAKFGWPPDGVGAAEYIWQPALEHLAHEYDDGHFEPGLASSWEMAADKSNIVLHLRKGVKFHDGSDFNAEAVKFNLDAWAKSKKIQDWKSIEILDEHTIRANFKDGPFENSYWTNVLAIPAIASKVSFEKNGLEWARANPVGTGPFKFVSHERDVRTVFTKNENYWKEGRPYLDGVEFIYIKDPMTQSAALRTGKATCLHLEWSKQAADLKAMSFDAVEGTLGVVALYPDAGNPDSPYADKRVRQALEHAIDREALVKARGFGLFQAAYQASPHGSPFFDADLKGYPYDPDKAKALLKAAGHPNGFETKIIPLPGVYDKDEMVIIQRFLGEVGIKASIDFVDYPRYIQYRMKGWGPNALFGFPLLIARGNPNRIMNLFYGPKRPMFPSLGLTEEFYALLKESRTTPELDIEAVKRVVKYISDEALMLPVRDLGQCYLMQKGLRVHNSGHLGQSVWHRWTPGELWLERK